MSHEWNELKQKENYGMFIELNRKIQVIAAALIEKEEKGQLCPDTIKELLKC